MKLAMTDMDIAWEDKEENKKRCRIQIEEAVSHHADIILFPEMTLTGFSMNVEKIGDSSGESFAFFSELAEAYRIAIGFGYVTGQSEGKGRNHFCLTDNRGYCLEDYEKIHPFRYGGEAKYYEGGEKICHTTLGGVRCGMFICYDLRFPECFQKLPLDTDVVFLIANWPESRIDHWYTLLKARAIEMQCFVVGINRTGEGDGISYIKSSAAYGPDGSLLKEESGKLNRYVELDIERKRQCIEHFSVREDRRRGIDYK